MSDKISICFCINDLYSQHLGVVLTSILYNNPNSFFDFYVLTNDITDLNKRKLLSLNEKYKNFEIKFINVDKSLFKNLKITIDYISIETYFRYILADLLPQLDKILYLDVDLVVNGDLEKLWNTDISNYYCASVEDINFLTHQYKPQIYLDNDDKYINAGVILFNLDKMRNDNISEKLLENNEKYKDIIKYQDQDIINITLRKSIKILDVIYNFTSRAKKQYPEKTKQAVIIHYVGPNKPWKKNSFNSLKRLYYKYYLLSPYCGNDIKKTIIYSILGKNL